MNTTKKSLSVLLICLLQSLPVFGNSTDLSEDDGNELKNMLEINKASQEELAKTELYLITNYSEILYNALTSNSSSYDNARALYQHIIKNYPIQMVESIIAKAVSEIISRKGLLFLAELISRISELDSELYEMMLLAPLEVYRGVSNGNHKDKYEFSKYLAYMVYKIQMDINYAKRPESFKSRVENLKKALPISLTLLLGEKFCLVNNKNFKFIYKATFYYYGLINRFIYLWYGRDPLDSTSYIKADLVEVHSDDGTHIQVILQGIKPKFYYGIEPVTKQVLSWETFPDRRWDIEHFDNENIGLSQHGLLMCATEMRDYERMYVEGRELESSANSECQWHLEECTF